MNAIRRIRRSFSPFAALAVFACAPFGASGPAALHGAPQSQMSARAAPAPVAPLVGRAVPSFSVPLAGGGALDAAALRGHWSVIEFWGLWCEDSLADLPFARALARAVAQDPDLRFVTIHVEARYGRWASADEFATSERIEFPIAMDRDRTVTRAFGVTETPTYLVVDPSGIIRAARGQLRAEPNPDGGVKTLIKQIAELRRAP